jgi:hypothetical protein
VYVKPLVVLPAVRVALSGLTKLVLSADKVGTAGLSLTVSVYSVRVEETQPLAFLASAQYDLLEVIPPEMVIGVL